MATGKKAAARGAAKEPARPKAQPKAPQKTGFEKAWKEYNSSLATWKESLARWQSATNGALVSYQNACREALESDAELLKKVSASWEAAWEEIGPEYIKQQTKMIEGIFKETNVRSIKRFNDQWEKFLSTSGGDSIRAYQEAIKRFNEAWQSGRA